MGSWSEACGFSGMEIGEGEVAYCLLMKQRNGDLNDGAFHHYAPVTTLLRGTYNDYGYLHVEDDEAMLAIFNEQAQLELKNGDDFSLSMLDGRADIHRWWIHGRAVDFLPTIAPDFPYGRGFDDEGKYKSVPVKNIGEAQDIFYAGVRRQLDIARDKLAESGSMIDAAFVVAKYSVGQLWGYRPVAISPTKLMDDLKEGRDVQPRLDAAQRISTLGYAMGELRKALAPCESAGPQHGGAEASVQFANFLIDAQAERAKRWGDE